MRIEVIKVVDNEDGSATVEFDMDEDSLRVFAKIGVLKALSDAAKEAVDERD